MLSEMNAFIPCEENPSGDVDGLFHCKETERFVWVERCYFQVPCSDQQSILEKMKKTNYDVVQCSGSIFYGSLRGSIQFWKFLYGFRWGQRWGWNIRFYKSIQNGYLGKRKVHLCVIMHKIIRFCFLWILVIIQVLFKWKVRCVYLRIFETVQNKYVEQSWVYLFVIRCKNIRLFIFVTFYSFGSIKMECNGGSQEL